MLVRLLKLVLFLVAWPILWLVRQRASGPSGFLALVLEGKVEDMPPPRRFWQSRSRSRVSVHELSELARELALDPHAKGLVVTLRDASFGMATATSLRDVFFRIRESGRKVLFHLPVGADTKTYFVATAGSEVFLGPQATLAPYGFAITTPYARAALDRVGVVPDVLARGRYKSAGESVVRDSMSEPQKEQLGALLDGLMFAFTRAVATGRGVDEARARTIIDGAPYTGQDAVSAGLADAALYDDAVALRVAPKAVAENKGLVSAKRYLERRRIRLGPILRPKVIGVVHVHGAIGQSASSSWTQATDERVIAALSRARTDRRVLGVILHIDSPGGSALASDRIHHELTRLAAVKPLVACMANVAASGGYYVAAAAHAIVAEPTTITGSIGVVAARFALEPLLVKLGIHTETLTRGAHAGLLHPTRPLSDEERAVLEREIETIYRAFVGVVAAGRKKSFDEVDELAQGRVWSGTDAHARGLVDELGGFDRALGLVRARIGSHAADAVPVVIAAPRNLRQQAGGSLTQAVREAAPRLAVELPGEYPTSLLALTLAAPHESVLAFCDVTLA